MVAIFRSMISASVQEIVTDFLSFSLNSYCLSKQKIQSSSILEPPAFSSSFCYNRNFCLLLPFFPFHPFSSFPSILFDRETQIRSPFNSIESGEKSSLLHHDTTVPTFIQNENDIGIAFCSLSGSSHFRFSFFHQPPLVY